MFINILFETLTSIRNMREMRNPRVTSLDDRGGTNALYGTFSEI